MYKQFGEEWKREMMRTSKIFVINLCAEIAKKKAIQEKALQDLFKACANLPTDEMERMTREINAASEALKIST